MRVPMPPTAVVEQSGDELRRLGDALKARAEEVLDRTVALTSGTGHEVDTVVQGSFERISRSSTIAVARWMEGEGMEVAIEAGQETWLIFGELAAQRAASLDEVDQALLLLAQRDGRRASRERHPAGHLERCPRRSPQYPAVEPRVQPAADVRVLREGAPPHRRGAHAARGGALLPRHPRPPHRPPQPHPDPRPRRADARALAAHPDPVRRRCSSTSTTSRASTTPSATPSATSSCRRSPRAWTA